MYIVKHVGGELEVYNISNFAIFKIVQVGNKRWEFQVFSANDLAKAKLTITHSSTYTDILNFEDKFIEALESGHKVWNISELGYH